MDTVKNIRTLKAELKLMAADLRADKTEIKKTQKENGSGSAAILQWKLLGAKYSYRHRHIAYSMLKGKTYEQIEPKCRENNKPNQEHIQGILDAYRTTDVCAGS